MKQEMIETKFKKFQGKTSLELLKLYDKFSCLTPELVVEEAKKVDSPIHDCFEWDDTEAARKFRLVQARILITTVTIKKEGSEIPIRAFLNIKFKNEENKRLYLHLNDIRKNPELVNLVTEQAYKDLISWKDKYENVKDYFKDIFEEIENLKSL